MYIHRHITHPMSQMKPSAYFRQTSLLKQLEDVVTFCQSTLNDIDGDISMTALSRLNLQIPDHLMDILATRTANNEALRDEFVLNSDYLFSRYDSKWGQRSIEKKKIAVMFCLKMQMRFECEQFDRILRKEGIMCDVAVQETHPAPPAQKYQAVECGNASYQTLTQELQYIIAKFRYMHHKVMHHMQKHSATPATSVLHRWEIATQHLRHTWRYAKQICPDRLGDLADIYDDTQFQKGGIFAMESCQLSDGEINTTLFERMALGHKALTAMIQTTLQEMEIKKQASRKYQIMCARQQEDDWKCGRHWTAQRRQP